jgi:hypothetical protein
MQYRTLSFLCVLAYHLLIAIEKSCSTKASTPPGRACATPSKRIRSAPSSCPPTTALRYAAERPQLPTQTSSRHIETSASPHTSSSQNTHGHSPPIVTNGRTISLKQHNFILKKLEVGLVFGCDGILEPGTAAIGQSDRPKGAVAEPSRGGHYSTTSRTRRFRTVELCQAPSHAVRMPHTLRAAAIARWPEQPESTPSGPCLELPSGGGSDQIVVDRS